MRHDAPDLLRHMVAEFTRFPEISVVANQIVEPAFLGAYRLFGLQKEYIEPRTDNVSEFFAYELYIDPFLHRIPGPEYLDQLARYGPVVEWLGANGVGLVDRDYVELQGSECPDGEPIESDYGDDSATGDFYRLVEFLRVKFDGLSPEERACVVYLHNALRGALVHSLALVCGAITPNDFAVGVAASQFAIDTFGDVSTEDHALISDELRGHAGAALEYVRFYRAGTLAGRLAELLEQGSESFEVEFKSTLRWDIKAGTNNREVTNSVIKTVAAFVNTRGGTLLIGVADDRTIVGIEQDGFASDDEFLRHLYQVLTRSLGAHVAPLVDARITVTARGRVCVVECARSPEPVLCQFKNLVDAFFVRTGPATVNLVGDDRENFKRLHWGEGT